MGLRGGCLYSIKGWVHLRACVIRMLGRNGKAVFVVSKFVVGLCWTMKSYNL
jgi:hypothetical protein